ncbi:DUF4911 domain-containing protein [Desulfonatronovibrio hydrogenovorans]|uniref:DUF4911 domain-containing protein n=1 Tax=Desulfonatronovibrio hydrogenovorans TaxID=53245 RepID=UPI00068ED658|nr:DUF4911 domain-containing protein [Desulfonatronovibrio hydrogenovorans]
MGQQVFSQRIYVQISRRDIALFKFLLESWDNLAYLTVIDKYKAVVQVVFGYGFEGELESFLKCAEKEMILKVVFQGSSKGAEGQSAFISA